MAKIHKFNSFSQSLSEVKSEPSDDYKEDVFLKAFKKAFPTAKFMTGYGNQTKRYDYSNGYVEHPTTCQADGWECVNPKSAKILEANGFAPLITKAYFFIYKPISKAEPKPVTAWMGLLGDKFLNYNCKFEEGLKTLKFDKEMEDFKKKCIDGGWIEDILKPLFAGWKKTSYKDAQKGSKSWGYGSQSVTYITKEFDSSYIIKDLDVALNMTREEVEAYIKSHYMFKKDKLKFDWDGGVMYVNGTYGEYWD